MRALLGSGAVTLVSVAAITAARAQPQRGYGPGMMWDYGYGWAHMLFGTLMMILFVGGIIVLVVLAIRWLSGSGHLGGGGGGGPQPRGSTPLDILKERYARGEIDADEYGDRLRTLREQSR